MGHGFLCITDAGCILNFESPSPFWFPAGQDLLDSSQLCVGIAYKGADFEQCDYTFLDWGLRLFLVLLFCFKWGRGVPGRTKCDMCVNTDGLVALD